MADTSLDSSVQTTERSCTITDPRLLRRHLRNPDLPVLVMFPRTGSHWLRMLMELYFERPSLVRVFYYPERTDYLTLATHDLPGGLPDGIGVDMQRDNVLYLYRHPVHTVYSQLRFHGESLAADERIRYWADLYGRHLDKWLHRERFTKRKTVITYEGMKSDLVTEFGKVADHFELPLDEQRFRAVAQQVSKGELHRLIGDERPEVVHLESSYAGSRASFEHDSAKTVWKALLSGRPHLSRYFAHLAEDIA